MRQKMSEVKRAKGFRPGVSSVPGAVRFI